VGRIVESGANVGETVGLAVGLIVLGANDELVGKSVGDAEGNIVGE
jgi:hypothetical protein